MQGYLAALTIVLLVGMVLTRVILMRRTGTRAVHFGRIDKTDFLIPPFALFYIYTVFAAAFNLPIVSAQRFFHSEVISWVGVSLCFVGLTLFLLSLVSFGRSFALASRSTIPTSLSRRAYLRLAAIRFMWQLALCGSGSSWCSPTGLCWSTSQPAFGWSIGKYCAKKHS
jgi:hypothetical protein